MNEQLLEEIGFTKGEIKVYFALLRLGETTTGRIIEKAQISSGKIYEILEKLMKKGLVSCTIMEKTKYFSAASPNRILDYLHEKEKNLEEKKREILKELPSLLAIRKAMKKEHETNLFKGFKGMQTAIFEALEDLSEKDEILATGIISHKKEKYNLLWQKWHKERISKKIICRAIFSDKSSNYFKGFNKMKFTEVRVLRGITPSAIDVMNDKVLIFTYGEEPSCLSIKNPEIAQSFKTFFETMWKTAKE
ncbi:MAG: helix-turn-helix domain-containing protein [Candidatus Diapherotrites archaeon]|nr:helix-turn-helix domain-containing protein [Candidatus Diapherotrites archaeon]